MPDYRIVEWNETNFDPESHPFTAEMYRRKKWAFVSDYVRLWAVFHHGGIYLDTDTEVFQSFDPLLHDSAFVGLERMGTAIYPFCQCFGSIEKHPLLQESLAYYVSVDLSKESELFIPNTILISQILERYWGAEYRDRDQRLKKLEVDPSSEAEELVVHGSWRLCLPNFWVKPYAIHHFEGSWLEDGRTDRESGRRWFLPHRPWISNWQLHSEQFRVRVFYYLSPGSYHFFDRFFRSYDFVVHRVRQGVVEPLVRQLKRSLGLDPDKRLFAKTQRGNK